MIKKILITVALSLTAILTPTYFVAADSYTVPMQILENGTNKTSYAAAYFAGSATVTPSDNGYAITSTITTDTSLGNYPVQMLSVDVDNINYHHNYTVGLVVDGSSVPATQTATVASESVAQSSPAASSEAGTSHQPSATSVTVSSESSKITSSSVETSASSTSSSVASTSSSAKKKAPTTKKEVPSKSVTRETPLPIAAIIGGGLVIGIASAIALNLLKKK